MKGIKKLAKLAGALFFMGAILFICLEKRGGRISHEDTHLPNPDERNRVGSNALERRKKDIMLKEFQSFIRLWRQAKRKKPGRIGSPYLVSVCMYILRLALGPDRPQAVEKRLLSLAPKYPREKVEALDELGEGNDFLGMTREQRLAFGDSAMKMAIDINIFDCQGAEKVIGKLKHPLSCFGKVVHFSKFSNGNDGKPFHIQIKATIDFLDQWSSIDGRKMGFEQEPVPGYFFSLDSKGGKKKIVVNYLHGKLKVPFFEGKTFQAIRLDLRTSYNVLFFAILPKEIKEAEEGWPKLLGEGEIFDLLREISGENPKYIIPVDLYLPKFQIEKIMESKMWFDVSNKSENGAGRKRIPVHVKNKTKFNLDAGGISFHTTVSVIGVGGSTLKYKVLKFNKPFLFLVYHRRFRTFLILGEYLGN